MPKSSMMSSGTVATDSMNCLRFPSTTASADRGAYVAAYSRTGRMRAGWAYFAAWPDTAKDFAQIGEPSL